jgi:hypothetical protein
MRTGVSYLGQHNPKHLAADMRAMSALQLDDVLLAAQENDFAHFTGKLEFVPAIAGDFGIRSIAIIWGGLNLFGGGRSSQFLLEHPEGFQVGRDGSHKPQGCYVNPVCVTRIEQMLQDIAAFGYQGYFIDEPTPLWDCYCPHCRQAFRDWYRSELVSASDGEKEVFRKRCVVEYVNTITGYCKANFPHMETLACLMPFDKFLWEPMAEIKTLDGLGTDIYWVNSDQNVEEMVPIMNELDAVCREQGKAHHEWLQCWGVHKGKESRILDQGHVLVREQPDALYVWAWLGQVGTAESCEDPEASWRCASEVLRAAKQG